MKNNTKKPIRSFDDLDVYQNSYNASKEVMNKIISRLPKEEKEDLCSQLRRSCKAIPRLIAEGYAKRHQKKGFQKYIDDALGESNEMIVSLRQCKDFYDENIEIDLYDGLIDIYDKTSRQLYNLSIVWTNFKEKKND
jgi:four helix bundle protein